MTHHKIGSHRMNKKNRIFKVRFPFTLSQIHYLWKKFICLNTYKKLASDTAIYGMSSIIGRFLNWWLVPYYSRLFLPAEYGVVTNLYSYVAFFLVFLTYGMETGFFRFASRSEHPGKVYSTSVLSLFGTSFLFILFILLFKDGIASLIRYEEQSQYILWLGIIVGVDAFTALPFAKLRLDNRPIKFAFIKLANITLNIGFNLFFLSLCPYLLRHNPDTVVSLVYSPEIGVGYVFISNLLATAITLILLLPEILKIKLSFDRALLVQMLGYSFPILIVGLAGMINQNIDKILIPFLIPEDQNPMYQVGIYGANYKIAVLMNMFIQAFRYAFEPFFFSRGTAKDDKQVHAVIMNYFVIFGLLIFLGITLYIDIVKILIDPVYHEGLKIVPLILMANLFLGIYYALSLWYKLVDKTWYGAYIALIGAAITLAMNFVLIPRIGYMGSAVAVFTCFLVMMVISYLMGQKHYPISYDLKSIFLYMGIAIVLYAISLVTRSFTPVLKYAFNTLLLLLFLILVFFREKNRLKKALNFPKK
jgi:O-antigen/teichoic acid export membrane protein